MLDTIKQNMEIFSLSFRVSYKSTFIVDIEITVVSDIGDKLSPKKLPHTIAPSINAGLQLIDDVNGKNMGTAIEIVPVEVPIHVEIIQHITNITIGRKSTLIFIFIESIKNAFEIPVFFNTLDKIPANIKITIQLINVLFFKFPIHLLPKPFLSLLRTYIKNTEKKPHTQKDFNEASFSITIAKILKIKKTIGTKTAILPK